MKCFNSCVVFQEIPDEVSLAFNITNCKNNCDECHSPHLREDSGDDLSDDSFVYLIKKYTSTQPITCILFMGGDQFENDLYKKLSIVKTQFKLKTALYSGNDFVSDRIKSKLDYIKVGPYKKEFGGLKNKNTNQRMYVNKDGMFEDITHKFQSKPLT